MAGTRKDDLWGCIDFHQEDAETPNAELLASLPPVRPSKPPQDTSAIYAFLGCATLPRLRKCNPRLHWTRGDHWRRGIQIVVRCFPDRQRLIDEAECWTPRCVVQCSDFSGPSRRKRELSIREASANPMTVEEHIRAGSLVEVPGTGYQEDEEPADY